MIVFRPTVEATTNSLTAERIAEITAQVRQTGVTADVLRGLPESAANAIDFLAATSQSSLISVVAHASEHPAAFVSPLQWTACCSTPALVTVWAHYDDDLIFGSPTIPSALVAGESIRTLFITGSDAGKGAEYATSRERGIRAAYDVMLGASHEWFDTTVVLRSGLTVTTTAPAGDNRVVLLFIRLADGGLTAGGFYPTGYQSLPKLVSGSVDALTTIDTGQQVTLAALENTISEVISAFAPQSVLTHLPSVAPRSDGDHPDHAETGTLIANLIDRGRIDGTTVHYAVGYPSETNEVNLGGDELQHKLEAFAAYAAHDSVLGASTPEECLGIRKFGDWLQRQYLVADAEIVRP